VINVKLDIGKDIRDLELIGKGTQGTVYLIDSQRCIKIFKKKKECKDELKTLLMAQGDIHFPKLYQSGENYIIREYVNGIELNHYLLKQKLTPQISNKLIELYEAMVKVGYLRQDAAIFHIFVLPSGELKLIDTAKAMKKKSTIPNLLISGLEDMGYKEDFFNFLKSNRPDFYVQWINYSKKKYKKKC
jgi:RIO-like serine/threonine protein kinase